MKTSLGDPVPAAKGRKRAQGFGSGKKVKTWKASPDIFPTELSKEAETDP
jgi:preprotein translocase subunit SecA